ncbi:MAG: lactate utilization protein [Methanothrix sp.]
MANVTKYSAANLLAELNVDTAKWNRIPSEQEMASATKAIEARGIAVTRVRDGRQALEKIKEIIPPGAEVMNGSSTTLIEIGYQELIDSDRHDWSDLHKAIFSENDAKERAEIRRKSVAAEYFLSGVNAIAMTGELLACDGGGSRVGAWPFAAKNLVLVSGVNKIVPTLQGAMQRIGEYAYPLEDARSKKVYGVPGQIGKWVIIANEKQPGRISLILVDEALGY